MSTDTHDHDHAGKHAHSHGVSADADSKRLTAALALIVGFMAGEVVAGIIVRSLALLSDAAHMLTDAGAPRRADGSMVRRGSLNADATREWSPNGHRMHASNLPYAVVEVGECFCCFLC
jgi:hypothetical protein